MNFDENTSVCYGSEKMLPVRSILIVIIQFNNEKLMKEAD